MPPQRQFGDVWRATPSVGQLSGRRGVVMFVQVDPFTDVTDQLNRSTRLALGCLCRMLDHLHPLRLQADVGGGGETNLQATIPQAARVIL